MIEYAYLSGLNLSFYLLIAYKRIFAQDGILMGDWFWGGVVVRFWLEKEFDRAR